MQLTSTPAPGLRKLVLTRCGLAPGPGAAHSEASRQWTTGNTIVPRTQPASKDSPPVLTFTVTGVCFLLSELQPTPHKGLGVLPEKPL